MVAWRMWHASRDVERVRRSARWLGQSIFKLQIQVEASELWTCSRHSGGEQMICTLRDRVSMGVACTSSRE